jgi:CDP-6-deoxy-D-xylo-4-hexulose-3-dehydrase
MSAKSYPLASSTWGPEEVLAIQEVLQTGNYTMGEVVKSFEKEFAQYIGTKHALMVNSGSSANLLMVAGLKYRKMPLLSAGDEVIVPAVSWSTTFYPIQQMGMVLNFVDIDLDTLNIDPLKIENSITSKTKAIFAVNLLGNPCSFNAIERLCKKYDLALIEDNCESLGAEYNGKKTGSIGIAGSHSFFFSHHMCTMEGGMITTDDTELFEAIHSMRAHGWVRGLPARNSVAELSPNAWENQFKFVLPGFNFRPLEIEAAAGLVQLAKLPGFISNRIQNGEYFLKKAQDFPLIRVQQVDDKTSWFGFSMILEGALAGCREEFVERLTSAGIESRPIVAGNFLKNPVTVHLPHKILGSVTASEKIDVDGLFIGNHHYPLTGEIDYFFDVLSSFIRQKSESQK